MASVSTLKLGSKSEVFQVQGHNWRCTTGLPSDVVVEVGEASFHLHKFPLLSRSGVLGRMVRECSPEFGSVAPCVLQFHDLPGGAKTFELIAKFCYDVKMELDSVNVVSVRCAAEKLEMTEEYGEGNLVRQSESFLTDLLGSWKDSIKLLEACTDGVESQAEELRIVSRSILSVATKAHGESKRRLPLESTAPELGSLKTIAEGGKDPWNAISGIELNRNSQASVEEDESWWYEDVSSLCLPMYKRFIAAAESIGMRPELVAGSILFYAQRHLPELNRYLASVSADSTSSSTNEAVGIPTLRDLQLAAAPTSEDEQRELLEEMVALLPVRKSVVPTKLLLDLYRFAAALRASSPCKEDLERRVGVQLDDAALEDLLIPNWNYDAETLFDVDCVQRMLDHFMLLQDQFAAAARGLGCSGISGEVKLMVDQHVAADDSVTVSHVSTVAKIIDDYLVEVAPDVNLRFHRFQSLAATIPNFARTQEDGLYRAIDTYLKAHPRLTDTEREQLCRLINCQKLSLEACTHAAQNERLPLRVVVQVLFFEQLRLRSSMAGWFLISENLVANPGSQIRRSYDAATTTTVSFAGAASSTADQADGAPSRELIREEDGDDGRREAGAPDADGMSLRMTELEKECSIMKVEIERLLKPKSTKLTREILPKKVGFKMILRPLCEGKIVPASCLRDGRRTLF